ncbi:MAG: peptide chain release factor N(5)-glutamine methyltransferase [Streptosporangiales bacterium]|nr:peptide chain release factor N(5)-glutamine methyltransferase [Streptosporangiales bacterium]
MSLLLHEIAWATNRLAEADVPSPRHDAEELAAYVHGVSRSALASVPDTEFDARYWVEVARRAAREPLQHITGRAYFRYVEVAVGPGVFVPRPETEVVVGWAIEALRDMDVADPLVVDLGAGSGAIALAIAKEVPRSRVHAVEADEEAFGWAKRNCADTAVELHLDDLLIALPELSRSVDLVISNPPYIPLTEWEYVAPEARDYDPPRSLWAGPDGLDAIRTIERTARRLLRPGGLLAVEHSDRQGLEVPRLFPESRGWADVRNHRDLANRDRFVTARKNDR